jgi:hypothetical protein
MPESALDDDSELKAQITPRDEGSDRDDTCHCVIGLA